MGTRLFVGRLSRYANERDIEDFFRGYGRINDIMIKANFAFVEFDDYRDADDALHDLNGKELRGERVSLEFAKEPPKGRDMDRALKYRGSNYNPRKSPLREGHRGRRLSPPRTTKWKVRIENLSTHYDWKDLKEMFRDAGLNVTYTDAHDVRKNEGMACFDNEDDMKRAVDKFDGKEVNGRAMKIYIHERARSYSRSRSRSYSRRRDSRSRSRSHSRRRDSRSRSRSHSDSPNRKRARSGSRGRSRTPDSDRGSRSPRSDRRSHSSRSDRRSRNQSPVDRRSSSPSKDKGSKK